MALIHFKRTLIASSISLFLTPQAFADSASYDNTAEQGIENISIVGKQRAYIGNIAPLENPAVNQIIDQALLNDAGAFSLNDALNLSASVARQNNFGGLWNAFSVRGFAGDINLPSGFLVNGFNAGRGFGGPRDLVGIESVEVLKGPRSALFGRGEPGGTVNLVTKRPTFSTEGYIKATLGSWNQQRLEGDYQTMLGTNDNLGVRLVGFIEDAESFRDTVETEKRGFYPSVTWDISDLTKMTYELEFTKQSLPFDRGVVFADDFGFSPREVFVGEMLPIDTEVTGHQFEVQHELNDEWTFLGGLGLRDTELKGDAFEPQFGSRQTYRNDGQTISRFYRTRDFDSSYTVVRGELSGDFTLGNTRHRLVIGADYDKFEIDMIINRYRSRFSGDLSALTADDISTHLLLNINNPVYGVNLSPDAGANTNRNEVLSGHGIYIQDQINLSDNFQVRLGLRYDDFEQDLTNLLNDPAVTTTTEDSRVSPQVGAVYQVNDGTSIYASYGEGYRQQAGSDFQGNQFAPNVTESAEIGVKWDLGALYDNVDGLINVTLFTVEQSNFLVNDDRPEATAVGFFSVPAGEADSTGLEFDANVNFSNDVNLWLSYAYTKAEFANRFADADGFGFTIEKGDPMINSPEHQLSLLLSKDVAINDLDVTLGGGLLYVGKRNGWVGSDFTLPSYTTAQFFADVNISDAVAVRLDVDNVFDETYYTNSYANVWVEPGAPRNARISLTYRF